MIVSPLRCETREGMPYEVRSARESEAGALLDHMAGIARREPARGIYEPGGFDLGVDTVARLCREGRTRPGSLLLVAVADGILGYCLLQEGARPKLAHNAELSMSVAPAWRRLGIGKRLALAAIQAARETCLRRLELRVFEDNEAARRLYASVGFREEGRAVGRVRQTARYVDEIAMALDVTGTD